MQQLFAATRNWVSFEGGAINLWCPSYDDSAKMALVRLFDSVFDYCQVDYATDGSGQIVPDEFQVGREEFEKVIDDLASWTMKAGDEIDSICTDLGCTKEELETMLRTIYDKADKEVSWVRLSWIG
jgi:hypothetical protein